MSVGEEAHILADIIWSYWKQLGAKPRMRWVELYQLCRYFLEECKKRGIDPQEIDLRSEIDARTDFKENKEHIKEILRIRPSPEEALEEQLARLTSGTEFKVIREKDLDKLLKYEHRAEQLARRVKELKAAREAERIRMEDEIRRLREELEKTKPLKVKLLEDVPPWLRAGQIIESRDYPWVLKLIEEGKAVRVEAPLPPSPKPPKPLEEDVRAVIEELRRLAGEI